MTKEEVLENIKDIPLGAKIQILQKSGNIKEVRLASKEINETQEKKLNTVTVPSLPAALMVSSHVRQGKYRVEIEDIVNIAWIEE